MKEAGDQSRESGAVLELTRDCCICRIPQLLRNINEEAYTPKLISIGPLHYGRIELNEMEKHKRMYGSKFRNREQVNAQKWEELVMYINDNEQRIRNHYLVSSNLPSLEYVDMILYDAVFIIELFERYYRRSDDFFLSNRQLRNELMRDFLLLENQLPYFVLNDLYSKTLSSDEGHPLFGHLSVNFFSEIWGFDWPFLEQPEVKHFTDLMRMALVKEVEFELEVVIDLPNVGIIDLPNATKLNESGLKLKGIKGRCMLDVSLVKRKSFWKCLPWFEVNELRIPRIVVHDDTEYLLRNIMAFEAFHYPTRAYICHYVDLMNHLIDTAKDVDLLVEEGVITNCVGNTEAITKMFNSLCSHIIMGPSCYYAIAEKVKVHYKYPWNRVRVILKRAYFRNLCTCSISIAATFLMILTLIQTICSIIQVYQGYTKE